MKTLAQHLEVNSGLRDDRWENELFNLLLDSNLYIVKDSVQMGPDGWPYLYVSTDGFQPNVGEDHAAHLIQWAYENAVGLALNPDKERPDYIFHYGLIWNYAHNKFFVKNFNEAPADAPIYVAQVSEDIIPQHAMNFIKDYIKSAGIDSPRGALISRDKLNYEFALSLESLGNPPQEEHEGIARGIGWFMPNHIPVLLVYEEKLQPLFDL